MLCSAVSNHQTSFVCMQSTAVTRTKSDLHESVIYTVGGTCYITAKARGETKKNKNVLQEQPRILLKILHHMQIPQFSYS